MDIKCPDCHKFMDFSPGQLIQCGGPIKPPSICRFIAEQVGLKEREPILQEREKTHGSFFQNAEISQKLLGVLKDYHLQNFCPVQRQAMDMICLKIARAMSNPKHKDHWDDIAGYAKLGSEACDE